jgi:Tn3 transposase DDE domain
MTCPGWFLCFGKEGVLRGPRIRRPGAHLQLSICSAQRCRCLELIQIEEIVGQLRAEGQEIDDEILSHVTPLLRKHINPFGGYHFDLDRIRKPREARAQILTGGFRLDVATTPERVPNLIARISDSDRTSPASG